MKEEDPTWFEEFCSHPIGMRIMYYPILIYGLIRRNPEDRRWYDRIDDKVILGALPFRHVAKELVAKENVRGVVQLNETYETFFITPSVREWEKMGVTVCQLPTADYNNAPSMEDIKTGIEFIENFDNNYSVYVHCKVGRSRSATLLVCYLVKKHGWDSTKALSFLQDKRPQIELWSAHYNRLAEFHKAYLEGSLFE